MTIKWDPRLRVGIDVIDLEHQMMIMLVRKLDVAIKTHARKQVLVRTVSELVEFTRFHFLSEENLMIESGYPELLAHEKVHSLLMSRLNMIAGRINRDILDPHETIDFLWDWLGAHVMQMDKALAAWLEARQIHTLSSKSYEDIFKRPE